MRITNVAHISDYKLKLTFGNKEVRTVDLAEKIKTSKGIFLPLKDLEYFKKVTVDDCQLSICWPNGADICPDVLYKMSKPISSNKKSPKRQISSVRASKQKTRRSKATQS